MIEKSHLHNFNSSTTIKKNTANTLHKTEQGDDPIDSSGSKFLSWIKGLINPLQNLPIISGIYSSMNSDKPSSDRDLIQSSAGGFLYGGPIGAMAGFGNWVFEKIFDKTPTELAFDTLGISKLWKSNDLDSKGLNKDKDKKKIEFVDSSFNPNKDNTKQSRKKSEEKKLLSSRGMSFHYPKWSPLNYTPVKSSKKLNLSSYKNNTENIKRSISIDA